MVWTIVALILSQLQLRSFDHDSGDYDEREDFQQLAPPSSQNYYITPQVQHQSQHVRFFMGIFTKIHQRAMRTAVRELFDLHNDTRVCAFGSLDGQIPPPPADHCQLMYTFVIGGATKGDTQIIKPRRQKQLLATPLLTKPDPKFNVTLERNNDVTFLNIKVSEYNEFYCRLRSFLPYDRFHPASLGKRS
jgi:hypothetical protein